MIVDQVSLTRDFITIMFDIDNWCNDMFGPEAIQKDAVDKEHPWRSEVYLQNPTWFFHCKENALAFRLRWI